MKRFALLLLIAVVLAGCGGAVTRATPGDTVEAQLLAALKPLTPEQALARLHSLAVPETAMACFGTTEANPETTVIACQWGKGANAMTDGRALIWREGGAWKLQPYPPEGVRGVGYFARLSRMNDDLIIVMNVAPAITLVTEQVQLLHVSSGQWQVAWLPDASAWTKGHATVAEIGLDHFVVETDSYGLPDQLFAESNAGDHLVFREEWAKEPPGYVRVSSTEVPTEYGAVVHFVTALARGDDAGAAQFAVEPDLITRAKDLGIPAAAPKGYFTRREGEGTFRLYANDPSEHPQWLVKVQQAGQRWWLVSEIDPG